MPTMFMFICPGQLVIGEKYFLRETRAYDPMPKYAEVFLIDYDSCPAFVYVVNREGIVERCSQVDLFQKSIVGRKLFH